MEIGENIPRCLWTGEEIVPDKEPSWFNDAPYTNLFYAPAGKDEWFGPFSSPSCALAGLIARAMETPGITRGKVHELIDRLEATIHRKHCEWMVKFTITVAPPRRDLGKKSLADFHSVYDHDTQVRIFTQDVPENEEIFEDIAPDNNMDINGKSGDEVKEVNHQWKSQLVAPGNPIDDTADKGTPVPRSSPSFIRFLRKYVTDGNPESVVVYFHPTDDSVFAIGSPKRWMSEGNRGASDVLGKANVWGPVVVFHRKRLRGGKRKN